MGQAASVFKKSSHTISSETVANLWKTYDPEMTGTVTVEKAKQFLQNLATEEKLPFDDETIAHVLAKCEVPSGDGFDFASFKRLVAEYAQSVDADLSVSMQEQVNQSCQTAIQCEEQQTNKKQTNKKMYIPKQQCQQQQCQQQQVQCQQQQVQCQSMKMNGYLESNVFNMPYSSYAAPEADPVSASKIRRLPTSSPDSDKKLMAVVVTICCGSSYDTLFQTVQQEAPNGRVSVYAVGESTHVDVLKAALEIVEKRKSGETADAEKKETEEKQENEKKETEGGEGKQENEKKEEAKSDSERFIEDMVILQPEEVVFNWECCSSFSSQGFGCGRAVIEFVADLVKRGYMVMFSDFSLKALINEWDPSLLGPKPFMEVGEFSINFVLRFSPKVLAECPSPQLQSLGELCAEGVAKLHAMGGTIAFAVNNEMKSDAYTLEVLTVTVEQEGIPVDRKYSLHPIQLSQIDDHKGLAGHVLITYPSGGKILCSSGHWIELSHLDVNEKTLLQVAEKEWGADSAQYQKIVQDLSSNQGAQQEQVMQSYAAKFVQSKAPCKYKNWSK